MRAAFPMPKMPDGFGAGSSPPYAASHAHAGQQFGIACHGGVIRMLLSILLDLPFPKTAAFEIDYASITQVLWTPPMARLQLVNFSPWRDLDG